MSKKIMPILDLKCGQMAVGMQEIKKKAKNYGSMSRKEFHLENKKNPISVIVAPDKSKYIIDGHHHAAASWLSGHAKVYVQIVEDFSHRQISCSAFWRYLKKHNWVHLYDQCGGGPHDPLYLPQDVRGLGDDPYRSLAWLVRKKGFIKNVSERFADFKWANFFRKHKVLPCQFERDFKSAQKKACHLAQSAAAKKLPGFIKKRNDQDGRRKK